MTVEAAMGTFGTGPFGSDGALDLLDQLADQPVGQRSVIFFRIRDLPDPLGWKFFPDEIVAAAAVVAASLPAANAFGRTWPTRATTLTRSWFPQRIVN
jgi:hypothetical protein